MRAEFSASVSTGRAMLRHTRLKTTHTNIPIMSKFPCDAVSYEGPCFEKPARLQALQRRRNRRRQVDGRPLPLRRRLLARHAQPAADPFGAGTAAHAVGRRLQLHRQRPEARRRVLRVHGKNRHRLLLLPRPRRRAGTAPTSPSPTRRSTPWPTCSRKSRNAPARSCSGAPPACSSTRAITQGAATCPNAEVFAYAAAQVKKAMEVTHRLGGEGYTFWGGREGYATLLNTDMKRELDHLAALPPHGGRLQEGNRLHRPVLHRAQAARTVHPPVRLGLRRLPQFPPRIRPAGALQAQHRDQPRHARRPHHGARTHRRHRRRRARLASTPTWATN